MIRHYEFDCRNCGAPILLHAETISQLFEDQDIQPNDSHSLAVPCFRCKHVGIYSPDRNSHYHHSAFRVKSPGQIVETEFLGLLECDGASCKFHAPLFSVMTKSMPDEERLSEIQSWIWDGMLCPNGHLIGATIVKPLADTVYESSEWFQETESGIRKLPGWKQ